MLTQREFVENLGIKASYISMIETGKSIPSEQLIRLISKTFQVNYEWLKEGKGEMYDKPQITDKGRAIIEEISKRLTSGDPKIKIPIGLIAELVGIDRKNFPGGGSKIIEFDSSIMGTVQMVVDIYKEGNKKKIEAILSFLSALLPEEIQK